jgi:hypothetical protein
MDEKELRNWFKKYRKFLNIRAIEIELEMPATTLSKELSGQQKMSRKWWGKVEEFVGEVWGGEFDL